MARSERVEGGGALERQRCFGPDGGSPVEPVSGQPVLGEGKGEHLEKKGGGVR